MKKLITLLVSVIMILSLAACKSKPVSTDNENKVDTPTNTETEVKEDEEVKITLDDVKAVFFNSDRFEGCEITDCVLTPDNAYGLIGVIQYTNADGNPACFAFVNKDFAHPVGLDADNNSKIADDSVLTYIGNGVIALSLENVKTGEIYDYTLGYSYDEANNNTHFESNASIRK